ncbi:MAG: hypothetical protein A2W05_08900 [Candidatus Schekmanbacteria bacterium RBG_16_38_10]|uniref:Glycosyltransferase RgtA/B/C/D-like domain-containing protein n=1 Tax=Candidatus Schekmanbacteria bacterium RBG_16_38_10 TaxID=1817879 RepID=A0A1F7S2U8_9BACT|nr:MAG: hypothetical protein A2W05_08900 [Candidatus Schekmanbacteria bacterium RBG_16_38_10]
MEVLYAFSILFSGYSLAHVMHYTILLAFLVLLYCFLKTRHSPQVGLLAAVFIFFLSDFIINATSGYIDAATTVFEVTALLLIIGWLEKEKDDYLYLAGLFFGLSLNVKYTPLYSSIGYIFIIGLAVAMKGNLRDVPKLLFKFSLFAVLGGGFWYVKNLVLYGNPFYPFLFGHAGFSNEEIDGIKRSITQFVTPRDLVNFVKIPYSFFLSRGGSLQDIFVCFIFLLAPLALINKKSLKVTIILLGIGVINLAMWFFVITHQTRFLFSTLIIIVILFAIAFSGLRLKRLRNLILFLIVLSVGNYFVQMVPVTTLVSAVYKDLIKAQEIRLIAGNISKADYLSVRLGPFVYVTDYINQNYTNQTVLNFWNHNAKFYLENGNIYTHEVPMDVNEYLSFLHNKKIKLLAVDYGMKRAFIYNPNWSSWRAPRLDFEQYVINNANLIYRYKGGALYRIK